MKKTKPTAIIIAEDHPLYRKALCDLVRGNPDFDVVAETGDGRMVEALVEQFKPGILLLDLNLPGMSGLEIAQHLRDRHPEVKIVVLTMNNDEAVFNSVIDAGVSGYVLKESAVDIILECMRAVVGGDHYISPSLAHHLVGRRRKRSALISQQPALDELTPMEKRILRLIAQNKMSKEIASLLSISEKTVENHRMNISNKLNLHGSNSLLKFAIEHRSSINDL